MDNLFQTCPGTPASTALLLVILGLWTLAAVLLAVWRLWRLVTRRKARALRPADLFTVRIRGPRRPQAVRREVGHG